MAIGLKGLLSQAQRVARKRGQPLTTAHVLLALYQRTAAGRLLGSHGVGELELIESLALEIEEHDSVLAFALERAERTAGALNHGRAGGLHLLLALIREPRSVAYYCLERLGASPEQMQAAVLSALEAGQEELQRGQVNVGSVVSRDAAVRSTQQPSSRKAVAPGHSAQQQLAAETESRRARDRARRHIDEQPDSDPAPLEAIATGAPSPEPARSPPSLDPELFPLLTALGRDLCRDALDGRIDPVLGRDSEVEQVLDVLTRRRANNPILVGPPGVGKTAVALGVALRLARGDARGLPGRILIELSTSALVSGTGVRGALSERLQALTVEIERTEGRVILFIDEIHSIAGAGEGAESLVSSLKSALARGALPCIGATTDAEYRRIFERDAALARRFTRIEIGEPSKDAALQILQGLSPDYEKHHGVRYEPAALQAAIDMSVRYMSERHLPDKAVALIDQAGARVRRRGGSAVATSAIAEIVAEYSSVPLERLLMRDTDALLALEAHLEQRVVGQARPVALIADALRKGAAGFRGERPLGTFLFLGPTGVGKTEMAKAICELLFPGCEPTRIDMSELSESHSIARLIGSPPGYIGHDDGGQLTEAVRSRPYQLVLLDEIEKAHSEVLLALLPLLDEGYLTDSRGRTVDFRNTIVVMTSNLGASAPEPRGKVGFGTDGRARASGSGSALEQRALAAARQALPPELWNRIDEPLYFSPLDRDSVVRIAQRLIGGVVAFMEREHGIAVEVNDSAIEALIAAGGYDAALGARPMRRMVGRALEAQLARRVLGGELRRGDGVRVYGEDAELRFEHKPGVRAIDAAE
jgi:ATP-dependent Clp protease ATP-binding subunit ClpC